MPISAFFALNAASFFISAALLLRVETSRRAGRALGCPAHPRGLRRPRPLPVLAAGVAVLGVAVTISSGTWMVGVPTFVRDTLDRGAGSFSLMAAAYAIGSVTAGLVLTRVQVRRKALASMLAWCFYLPAYGLFAFAGSFGPALVGAALCGVGQGSRTCSSRRRRRRTCRTGTWGASWD